MTFTLLRRSVEQRIGNDVLHVVYFNCDFNCGCLVLARPLPTGAKMARSCRISSD